MMLEDSDLRLVIDRLEDSPDQIAASYLADASSSIWIASGLAKISALYGVSMMQKVAGVPARFISPLEYVLNLRVKCLPVLISLRGSHEDAVEVAESIVGRKSERAIILTGDPLGRAACVLSQGLEVGEKNQVALATGPLPDRDKRFVNFKSILMLSAVTNRLVYSALGNESECDLDCNEIGYAWERAKEGACRLAEQICSVEM